MKISLTVNCNQSWSWGSISSNISRHAGVVGGVGELGLVDQQVPGVGEDEVGVHAGVDGFPVTQPGQDLRLGVTSGWVADQLSLRSNLDVLRVGRSLEIFTQIWNK